MEIIEFVQKSFLFLLPGVIGSYMYSKLNVQKESHYYLKFLEMIVISFFAFLVTDVFFRMVVFICPCFKVSPIDAFTMISANTENIPTLNVLVSIVNAIVIAYFLTKMQYENWLFKIANKLGVTCRIDNQTVWEHIFDDSDIVILRDYITKNIYFGSVFSYSDNSDNREICLENVKVYNEKAEFLYDANMVYLSRAHNEFSVEVHNDSVLCEEE